MLELYVEAQCVWIVRMMSRCQESFTSIKCLWCKAPWKRLWEKIVMLWTLSFVIVPRNKALFPTGTASSYLVLLALILCTHAGCSQGDHRMDWFAGKNAALERAIDLDNVDQLRKAIAGGAEINAKGRGGVTPLEYALGHFKKATYKALLDLHADSNQRTPKGTTRSHSPCAPMRRIQSTLCRCLTRREIPTRAGQTTTRS